MYVPTCQFIYYNNIKMKQLLYLVFYVIVQMDTEANLHMDAMLLINTMTPCLMYG